MQVYTPAALLLLGATALLASPGLQSLAEARSSLASFVASARPDVGVGAAQAIQLIFGYFAFSGLIAVEWGMAVRDRRDVRIGGWISVILAGSYCALMAVLTVAGALGKPGTELIDKQSFLLASPLTFHWAVFRGIGGMIGGVILLLFGLATLPAACYAAWTFARRLSDHWPRIGRSSWTWIGGAAAFLLTAVSWASRLEVLFSLMGAIFAPAVGALVADAWRQRGEWKGIRQGFHRVGMIAWVVGVVIGLVPLFAAMIGSPTAQQFQPAAVFAFLASAGLYTVLAALGPEQPWLPLPDIEGQETAGPVPIGSEKEAAASVQS
jgi:cytosine permease